MLLSSVNAWNDNLSQVTCNYDFTYTENAENISHKRMDQSPLDCWNEIPRQLHFTFYILHFTHFTLFYSFTVTDKYYYTYIAIYEKSFFQNPCMTFNLILFSAAKMTLSTLHVSFVKLFTSKGFLTFCIQFLSRVSILLLTRDIDIAILSVCPSVCLSVRLSVCPWHAGIVWKRLNVSS